MKGDGNQNHGHHSLSLYRKSDLDSVKLINKITDENIFIIL